MAPQVNHHNYDLFSDDEYDLFGEQDDEEYELTEEEQAEEDANNDALDLAIQHVLEQHMEIANGGYMRGWERTRGEGDQLNIYVRLRTSMYS